MNSARLVPATSAAFDWESSPREYQSSAAATRISFTNSLGDNRSAERAPSGTSNIIVGISLAFPYQDTATLAKSKQLDLLGLEPLELPGGHYPNVSRPVAFVGASQRVTPRHPSGGKNFAALQFAGAQKCTDLDQTP